MTGFVDETDEDENNGRSLAAGTGMARGFPDRLLAQPWIYACRNFRRAYGFAGD
jgi:hypothetical protein